MWLIYETAALPTELHRLAANIAYCPIVYPKAPLKRPYQASRSPLDAIDYNPDGLSMSSIFQHARARSSFPIPDGFYSSKPFQRRASWCINAAQQSNLTIAISRTL